MSERAPPESLIRLPTLADITPTQRKVAELVAIGACYKDIGKMLKMKDSTARVHVNAIAARLPDDDLTPYRRVMIWVICQQIETRKAKAS